MTTEATQSTFLWQGVEKNGSKASGVIRDTSSTAVRIRLHQQGVRAVRVRRKSGVRLFVHRPRISASDLTLFTRQLATMIKSGIPLVQSLDIVGESLENSSMRQLVQRIKDDIASGSNFADSLRRHGRYFDDLFCNLIEAGEQSGTLETMLERLATYQEKSQVLKSKVKKAMTYPIAVTVIAIAVTTIMLMKVVPQFAAIFSSFGAQLPAFTLFILGLSDWVVANWWMALSGAGVSCIILREAGLRSERFRHILDKIGLKFPIIGPIIRHSCLARFSRTLTTTFAAGVPLADALDSVAGATGNVEYAGASRQIRDDVIKGRQLSHAIRNTGLFPEMVIQMVAIGEESGALDTMLDKCASHHEAQVNDAIDGLMSLMEPTIMAILGILVGGLMIAMYLPIFQLGSVM